MKLLATVTGAPLNGGTVARRNTVATQLPTDVPPKAPPMTTALVTRPLGAKVTLTLPLPVGPPGFLHPEAPDAAIPRADFAAPTLKFARPEEGFSLTATVGAFVGSFSFEGCL